LSIKYWKSPKISEIPPLFDYIENSLPKYLLSPRWERIEVRGGQNLHVHPHPRPVKGGGEKLESIFISYER
jgi:hypothetical protein